MAKSGAIGFDEAVSIDDAENASGSLYNLLPAGDYDFVVKGVTYAKFLGSQKLDSCDQVNVELEVGDEKLKTLMEPAFFMHTKTLGFIFSFMESIGLRKKGESTATRIPWKELRAQIAAGKRVGGRLKLSQEEYTSKKDGSLKTKNVIKKYYPLENAAADNVPDEF